MGQFDDKIKDAQKIADSWIDESKKIGSGLIQIKKENLKVEKDAAKRIQAAIDANAKADKILDDISACRKEIKEIAMRAETKYEKHRKWALGEPREGVDFICKKVKVEKGTDAYKAVDKAMKRVLIDTAKQFAETENVWKRDLEPAIKIMQNRLDSFEKVAFKEGTKNDTYMKQFAKDVKLFEKLYDDIMVNLKLEGDSKDLKTIQSGAWDKPEMAKIVAQKFQVYEKKLGSLPKLKGHVEKNYHRIVKSVPQAISGQPAWHRVRAPLDKILKKAQDDLKYAEAMYNSLVKAVKAKYAAVL